MTKLCQVSLVSKESACSAGDQGLIPGLGRSPEEGNGNILQYSCLEKSMDKGAWWATSPWDHKGSDMTERLTHFCLSLMQKWSEVKWKSLSGVWLFATPWTIQSMEFFRPEYWSTQPFPSPGIFPTQGLNPGLPHCRWIPYQPSHKGSPLSVDTPGNLLDFTVLCLCFWKMWISKFCF